MKRYMQCSGSAPWIPTKQHRGSSRKVLCPLSSIHILVFLVSAWMIFVSVLSPFAIRHAWSSGFGFWIDSEVGFLFYRERWIVLWYIRVGIWWVFNALLFVCFYGFLISRWKFRCLFFDGVLMFSMKSWSLLPFQCLMRKKKMFFYVKNQLGFSLIFWKCLISWSDRRLLLAWELDLEDG